jgi:hypothetical protein
MANLRSGDCDEMRNLDGLQGEWNPKRRTFRRRYNGLSDPEERLKKDCWEKSVKLCHG